MSDALYAAVRFRARFRCEYCRLPEAASDFTFPVDHVIARQHQGQTTLENLALACPRCNAHKGPNLATVDWPSEDLVRLYRPRQDRWEDHFRMEGAVIMGGTAIGKGTARLFDMNSARRVATRQWLMEEGLF
jgi:hypothetical protein